MSLFIASPPFGPSLLPLTVSRYATRPRTAADAKAPGVLEVR